MSVLVRFFVGCQLGPELHSVLNTNALWQQHKSLAFGANALSISEIHYDGKNYIGVFLEPAQPTLAEIEKANETLLEQLQSFCPTVRLDEGSVCIIPQIFLS